MKSWIWIAGIGLTGLLIFAIGTHTSHQKQPASIPAKTGQNIRIEILNGCGKDGVATRLGTLLRARGFDVMTLGNASSYAFTETLVIDRVGKMRQAQRVADIVGTQNLIQQITPDPFRLEEVTIIVGRDYAHLPILKSQSEVRRQ